MAAKNNVEILVALDELEKSLREIDQVWGRSTSEGEALESELHKTIKRIEDL